MLQIAAGHDADAKADPVFQMGRSPKTFREHEMRRRLHAPACNLISFLRCIKLPEAMTDRALTSL
ncbi:hypothetical protein [uncultured Roseibium sp.]|uniref:hypothetical protein n=1 Tax=uncultured Roseibium sp. TaxID=1936171 RepID=UPI00374DAC62